MDFNKEDMTSSHSERDIYEGCLALMESLTGSFYDYIEFLGVDLSEYPPDEQFNVRYTPSQIVDSLFLMKTTHSGGTSQAMKCKELGIDPSKDIHFNFDLFKEDEE